MKIFQIMILMILIGLPAAYADATKNYYENGKIQGEFTDDMAKSYYQNGQVSTITPRKDGEPHGKSQSFYENGVLMSEIEYRDGEKIGISKEYDKTGKLKKEQDYTTGAWKTYDENGKVTGQGVSRF
ncbi:MAG: hypothetical protein EXS63_07945 [Candidatus Omnitrophica bacterium]|nr:hypothetical protein [Candidatus Omnitrophota bacterium]